MIFKIVAVCKGGGYRYCRTEPPHPKRNAKGLYPLHRVMMENKIGRLLEKWEDVHHIDEDKTNDSPDNLEVKSKSEHSRHHHPEVALIVFACRQCGEKSSLKPHLYRLRQKRSKNGLFCSRHCMGQFYSNRR